MNIKFRVLFIFFVSLGINFFPFSVAEASFSRNLKFGLVGDDVRELQVLLNSDPATKIANEGPGSPGQETNYFGLLTEHAVIRFQEKYRSEVLLPVGLFSGSGFVGAMTRAKLVTLASSKGNQPVDNLVSILPVQNSKVINPVGVPVLNNPDFTEINSKPEIFSVYPNRVRRGDVVTVVGKNFSRIGNMVELGDGPIYTRFENLPSLDGEKISFVYEPPDIKSMTKEELLALPTNIREQIEKPLQNAGASLDAVLTPYKGIESEAQFVEMLKVNGFSSDSLYHHFFVIVKNEKEATISKEPLLYGIHKLPFDSIAKSSIQELFANIKNVAGDWFNKLDPVSTAHAQLYGGGVTSGIIFICTCSGSVLTFQTDVKGGGTGLYAYSAGFVPSAGSCKLAGSWLGGYITGTGICQFYVGLTCVPIISNMPILPIGCSL